VLSILILISSFDNKHTMNVTLYIGFDVYPNLKERKEKNVKQGMYLEEDNIPILEAVQMKTKDKMCSL